MATEFIMPKLGLTMEEGTILEWLVDDGAAIEPGVPVLRIETDKVESDVEAVGAGRFVRAAAVGDTFPCGAVIGYLLAEGEEAPVAPTPSPAPTAAPTPSAAASVTAAAPAAPVAATRADGRVVASPNARRVAADLGVDLRYVRGTGPGGRIVSEDVEEAAASGTARRGAPVTPGQTLPLARAIVPGSPVPASFAARQLADLLGVDLGAVAPDPIDGRVTRDGVAAYVRARLAELAPPAPQPTVAPATPAASAATPAPLPPAMQPPTQVIRMSGMRGTIAKRMHASLQQMAQLTLFMDADLDAVVADRNARKASGSAPGFTDYIVAAAARALRLHPAVNSQVTDEGIALLPEVHVGMAVAVESGLMVPVVRNADQRPLADLSAETTRLAEAARTGSLALAELEGGTFSVSALGMFGVDGFTPVINPPNTAILGVGRLRDDVVLVDGQVSTTKRLTLSLTWDHRVFDGAPAAQFCQSIVQLLADPAALDRPA
jgi:pyruvate dehydrogenase E2 component (dihydrolipoamide acetyltransferase)